MDEEAIINDDFTLDVYEDDSEENENEVQIKEERGDIDIEENYLESGYKLKNFIEVKSEHFSSSEDECDIEILPFDNETSPFDYHDKETENKLAAVKDEQIFVFDNAMFAVSLTDDSVKCETSADFQISEKGSVPDLCKNMEQAADCSSVKKEQIILDNVKHKQTNLKCDDIKCANECKRVPKSVSTVISKNLSRAKVSNVNVKYRHSTISKISKNNCQFSQSNVKHRSLTTFSYTRYKNMSKYFRSRFQRNRLSQNDLIFSNTYNSAQDLQSFNIILNALSLLIQQNYPNLSTFCGITQNSCQCSQNFSFKQIQRLCSNLSNAQRQRLWMKNSRSYSICRNNCNCSLQLVNMLKVLQNLTNLQIVAMILNIINQLNNNMAMRNEYFSNCPNNVMVLLNSLNLFL